ncbi:acyltransferase family protein [Thiolapillus sp.]
MNTVDSAFELEKKGTSARIYLDALTGLRGIAAVWVALWHLWGFAGRPAYELNLGDMHIDLTPLVRTGWAGVDIFFVLSGFVLGLAYCQAWLGNRPAVKTREYFRRRLLRVLPAYYVQILILLLIMLLAGRALPSVRDLLPQLLMLHNILGSPETQLNPVYWTLPVEFDFYLILPLLAFSLAPPRWGWLLLGAMLLVLGYRYFLFGFFLQDMSVGLKNWWLNQLPGRLDQFVAGMLAAWLFSVVREKGEKAVLYRWRQLLLLTGLGGFAALAWYIHRIQPIGAVNTLGLTYWGGHWSLFIWNSLAGLSIAMVVLALTLGKGLVQRLLASRVLMYLGLISYSLYLWHFPLIKWLHKAQLPRLIEHAPLLNSLLWAVVPVLLVSSLSYWFVERPFLKIRHQRDRQ